MKYVIDKQGNIALGSLTTMHRNLLDALGSGSRIASAGHCIIRDGRITVFGESIGFGILAKPEDAATIEAHLGI